MVKVTRVKIKVIEVKVVGQGPVCWGGRFYTIGSREVRYMGVFIIYRIMERILYKKHYCTML